MCDFSERLIAWMDGELAENEATVVERHVRACAECSARVSAYDEASCGFAAYYDAATQTAMATKTARKLPGWAPVVAAVAAAAVLLLALLPRSVRPIPPVPQAAQVRPPITLETAPKPLKPAQRRHIAARRKSAGANWAMAGPAIQIAIPADAMFPPGAVPEGVTYIANLSFAADGSVQGLRLQP